MFEYLPGFADGARNNFSKSLNIGAWSAEAGVFKNENEQKTLLQRIVQSKPVLEASFQLEQNISKHLQGNHCLYLAEDDIASKQHSGEHESVEGLSTSGAFKKSEIAMSIQNEGSANVYLSGEQPINTHKADIFSMQHVEEHEHVETCPVLGAGRKFDPIFIHANSEEHVEDVNQILHFSMEMHVKADNHEESLKDQLENEEQCVSLLVTDNALRQYNDECIDNGKLLVLKALSKSDGGVKERNQIDEEKPYAVPNLPLSTVFEGSAKIITCNGNNDLKIGDLVWAKVRSHPWWPAQVFNPSLASEAAKKLEQSGRLLIAFFGDRTFAWLQKSQLIAFQPNFEKKVKQTENKIFCKGVAEALEEICKLSESSLICHHHKGTLSRLISTSSKRQSGSGSNVNAKDCKLSLESAERVNPAKILEFIRGMAIDPFGSCNLSLENAELRGHAYGFRGCMVALSTTDLLQNMQPAETPFVHHNQQKRKTSYVDLYADSGAGAKTKKVKTSDVTEVEKPEASVETLLALACHDPKLLRSLVERRSRKGLLCPSASEMGCSQALAQMHDLEPISGSEPSRKATTNTAIRVYYRKRRESKAQDAFGFVTSQSEENLCEAGNKDPKSWKESCSAEISKLTRSEQSKAKQLNSLSLDELDGTDSSGAEEPREIEMRNPENKATRFLPLGNSTSNGAIRLTKRPFPGKCAANVSSKTSKCRSKKNVIGSSAKTRSSSEHDNAVLEDSALDVWHFSTVQLYQSLKLLAKDPWNNAEMIRCPWDSEFFLRFRLESVKTEDRADALFNALKKDEPVSSDNTWVVNENSWRDDQLSKALDTFASKTCNELPSKHSTNSLQAARKWKSKFTQTTLANSPKKGSISMSTKRLYSPAPEVREPMETGPFENNGKQLLAASNTERSSPRNYKKCCAPLQLGIFMRFPQDFTLPSEAQLKAMFLQFGPVEPSGVTVFKELASAQVVFRHGEDAKAAYRHVKRTAMFGRASLIYKLCHFSFPVKQRATSTVHRGSSLRVQGRLPSHEDKHMPKRLEVATSLKERVSGHLRAVSELSWKGTKNGQEGKSALIQHSRHDKVPTDHRNFDSFGDILQERMATLLRRVTMITGKPTITLNTN